MAGGRLSVERPSSGKPASSGPGRELPPGEREVTALDINGAYLSALKTHFLLGQLDCSAGFDHDRRRAGVHLIILRTGA